MVTGMTEWQSYCVDNTKYDKKLTWNVKAGNNRVSKQSMVTVCSMWGKKKGRHHRYTYDESIMTVEKMQWKFASMTMSCP